MLYLLLICSYRAFAVMTLTFSPQPTTYVNSTSNLPLAATHISSHASSPSSESTCMQDCGYYMPYYWSVDWSKAHVITSTVATILYIIDDSTNTTKTTTSFVESFLVNGTVPSNMYSTNAAGTVTSVALANITTGSTTHLAYPTGIISYPPGYNVIGTLPLTYNNDTTCLTANGYTAFDNKTFATPTPVPDPDDPKGLQYVMVVEKVAIVNLESNYLDPTFNQVVEDCSQVLRFNVLPQGYVSTMTFLTTTSSTMHTIGVRTPKLIDPPSRTQPPFFSTISSQFRSGQRMSSVESTGQPAAALNTVVEISIMRPMVSSADSNLGSSTSSTDSAISRSTQEVQIADDTTSDLSSITATQASQTKPVITVGGFKYTTNPFSQYLVADQTLQSENTAFQILGTSLSLASGASEIRIGASAFDLESKNPYLAPLTIGNSIYSANSVSQYLIASQTLIPGGTAIPLLGTPVSLASGGSAIIIGTRTFDHETTNQYLSPLTIGASVYKADSASQYLVASQTLKPGGFVILLSGTPISLATSANEIIIGTSSLTLITPTALPLITLDNTIYTPNSLSDFVIDGKTLFSGGPAITVSGTPISLVTSADEIVVGTRSLTAVAATALPLLTLDGKTYAPNSVSDFIIDGQTLVPGGPAITISGTPVSLATGASDVVIGTSTITEAPGIGIGGFVWSGIGGNPPTTSLTAAGTVGTGDVGGNGSGSESGSGNGNGNGFLFTGGASSRSPSGWFTGASITLVVGTLNCWQRFL